MKPEKKKQNRHQIQLLRLTSRDNSPIQDYFYPDDQTQPTFEMTPGFKPFTENIQEFRSDGAWNVSFCTLFGKAQKLSVCYKLVKCYGNSPDKFKDKKYSFSCFSSAPRTTYCTDRKIFRNTSNGLLPILEFKVLFLYMFHWIAVHFEWMPWN